MSRRWPTLFDIARTKRAELLLKPGRPGERTYRNARLNVELILWHDGDEAWRLTIRRIGAMPDPGAVAFARAAYQVPDEAEARPFENRREQSPKTGNLLTYHGLDLIWKEVV
jgi:hypothetical protein